MRFCPICENLLLPKHKKLYCNACNHEFELNKKDYTEYKIIKKIKRNEKEEDPIIIKEGLKEIRITHQDRKAYEEFFDFSGENG